MKTLVLVKFLIHLHSMQRLSNLIWKNFLINVSMSTFFFWLPKHLLKKPVFKLIFFTYIEIPYFITISQMLQYHRFIVYIIHGIACSVLWKLNVSRFILSHGITVRWPLKRYRVTEEWEEQKWCNSVSQLQLETHVLCWLYQNTGQEVSGRALEPFNSK